MSNFRWNPNAWLRRGLKTVEDRAWWGAWTMVCFNTTGYFIWKAAGMVSNQIFSTTVICNSLSFIFEGLPPLFLLSEKWSVGTAAVVKHHIPWVFRSILIFLIRRILQKLEEFLKNSKNPEKTSRYSEKNWRDCGNLMNFENFQKKSAKTQGKYRKN